jgi:simple sugar transport system substrate-binding protein
MMKGPDVFDPYDGPIKDNTGKLMVKEGTRASKGDLLSIMYYVDGVAGSLPK